MERCDVIVIGGGSAAFEAAVAARENGADKILMLEKAPESEYGGNARYSGTGFRFWHNGPEEIREFLPEIDDEYFKSLQISPYTKEEFSADLMRMTLGRMDPALAQTLVEQSNAAIHWMKDIGIRWDLLKEHAKVGNKRYFERGIAIHVAGGGVGQLEQWRRIAEERNIEIRFSSAVSAMHGNTQSRYDYPFGISVNALGQRFFDEGEAQHSYTYAKTGRTILAQPGAVAWQIYDSTGIAQHRYPHHQATFEEAADIPELARKIGLAAEVLVHTIEEFNAACRDDVSFDPTRPDGKKTHGLTIPKSNWANRIENPPYRAYPVTCGITFTFGGVKVNPKAQVLNSLHEPIKGLYASGDILGLFFHNYPAFTGQTRNAVFSRLAGRHAAAES